VSLTLQRAISGSQAVLTISRGNEGVYGRVEANIQRKWRQKGSVEGWWKAGERLMVSVSVMILEGMV
jgi:hypothetical protein